MAASALQTASCGDHPIWNEPALSRLFHILQRTRIQIHTSLDKHWPLLLVRVNQPAREHQASPFSRGAGPPLTSPPCEGFFTFWHCRDQKKHIELCCSLRVCAQNHFLVFATVLRCFLGKRKLLRVPLSDTVIHKYFASLKLLPSSMQRLWHPDCPKSFIGCGPRSLSPDVGPQTQSCKQTAANRKLLLRTPALGDRPVLSEKFPPKICYKQLADWPCRLQKCNRSSV